MLLRFSHVTRGLLMERPGALSPRPYLGLAPAHRRALLPKAPRAHGRGYAAPPPLLAHPSSRVCPFPTLSRSPDAPPPSAGASSALLRTRTGVDIPALPPLNLRCAAHPLLSKHNTCRRRRARRQPPSPLPSPPLSTARPLSASSHPRSQNHPPGASSALLRTQLEVDTSGLFLAYSHASGSPSDATFNVKDLRWGEGVSVRCQGGCALCVRACV